MSEAETIEQHDCTECGNVEGPFSIANDGVGIYAKCEQCGYKHPFPKKAVSE